MSPRGLLVAATASHSGKTTITLGLARALRRAGTSVACAKSGPDYIDPGYLAAASGQPCPTLDGWSMTDARLHTLAPTADILLVEGAMGLYDGAPPDATGSSADLAKRLRLPVILVVDCASMGQSVAALVAGFTGMPDAPPFAGLILNRVGSDRHKRILHASLNGISTPILGTIPRNKALHRPSRHLGLLQASEHASLDTFLDQTATHIADHIDIPALTAAAQPLTPTTTAPPPIPALGTRIAIASDAAFTFAYDHLLNDWSAQGASLHPFSPLADETPDPDADAIYLPGGYPELHAQRLTRAGRFRKSMADAAARGTRIYGECGGYMVLGRAITDARGVAYPMLGLLDLETAFDAPKLHLGYRSLTPQAGPFSGPLKAHEFHYARTLYAKGAPLFAATDAEGTDLGPMGLVSGSVSGSFAHIIDCAHS